MLKLTHKNFAKAREFIFANGDAINRAWFRYHFEDSNTDAFMAVLAQYQHDCGGFGGLCDEFEYQGPCLKSTEIAISYIFGLSEKPPAGHPVIQKMMMYILDQYIPHIGNWGEPFVPEINEYPHVPWSNYRGSTPPPMQDDEERIKKSDVARTVGMLVKLKRFGRIER